jgi:hypothetical protein
MFGPRPLDFWNSPTAEPFDLLRPGQRYRVTRTFVDFDGDEHPEGESWIFLGHNYLPAEDGLSLFVSLDGEHSWHIRMQWLETEQGTILENLEDYVSEQQAAAV